MVKEMTFEIFYSYIGREDCKEHRKVLGVSTGVSFLNACENFANQNPEFRKYFDRDKLTYKGHLLEGALTNSVCN